MKPGQLNAWLNDKPTAEDITDKVEKYLTDIGRMEDVAEPEEKTGNKRMYFLVIPVCLLLLLAVIFILASGIKGRTKEGRASLESSDSSVEGKFPNDSADGVTESEKESTASEAGGTEETKKGYVTLERLILEGVDLKEYKGKKLTAGYKKWHNAVNVIMRIMEIDTASISDCSWFSGDASEEGALANDEAVYGLVDRGLEIIYQVKKTFDS